MSWHWHASSTATPPSSPPVYMWRKTVCPGCNGRGRIWIFGTAHRCVTCNGSGSIYTASASNPEASTAHYDVVVTDRSDPCPHCGR